MAAAAAVFEAPAAHQILWWLLHVLLCLMPTKRLIYQSHHSRVG